MAVNDSHNPSVLKLHGRWLVFLSYFDIEPSVAVSCDARSHGIRCLMVIMHVIVITDDGESNEEW